MSKPFLSIVVPVPKESVDMPVILVDLDKKLSESEYSYEIIVAGDDSTSGTGESVSRLSRNIKDLKFVENKGGRGIGWMVRNGMLAAKGNFRLFILSGNSVAVRKFEEILPAFKDGYQAVIGGGSIADFGCFAEDAAERIFGAAKINGWGFTKEIIALSRFFGFRIKEAGLPGGGSAAGVRPSVLWDMIRIRYWLKKNAYRL